MSDLSIAGTGSTTSSATQAYIDKVYDLRDTNEDGKVSVKESETYSEKHPSPSAAATEAPAVPASGESQELAKIVPGQTIDVTT